MSSLTFSGPSQLHSPQTKSLAIPAPGRKPNFDDVAGIALTAALCNLSVCVLCLTLARQCFQRGQTQQVTG
jgi:hypothetical protein